MKSSLFAVALVLAILIGLKAFTRAVAQPVEHAQFSKDAGAVYLMPLAMRLLDGASIEEVAAEVMKQAEPAPLCVSEAPSGSCRPQAETSFLQFALRRLKAAQAENALQLKGIITGPRSLILVNHVTIAPGEDARVPLVGRAVTVRCLQVTAQSARVLINGKLATLCMDSKSGI
jgi:hypothetical protein